MNLGSRGTVTAGGELHTLEKNDMLYVGRGTRDVLFSSADPSAPAVFFFVSFPAHTAHPAVVARHRDAERSAIGSAEGASRRTIRRFIHPGGVKSCQLVMGLTELESGCVWNTMPPHTHSRRMEVYLYYDLGPEDMVVHLMGTPVETRSLIVHGLQGVISPGWSIHCGAATRPYSFIWAMGGENQEFADMDPVAAAALR